MGEVRDQHYLKNLQTRQEKLKGEIDSVEKEKKDVSQKLSTLKSKLHSIENEIKSLSTASEVKVTEHAMLRYFEKVLGYNLEEIKKKIVPPEAEKHIKHFGSGKFPVMNSHRVVAKNFQVVTIIVEEKGEKI